jgi:AAA+ superfamily predicted ATPase
MHKYSITIIGILILSHNSLPIDQDQNNQTKLDEQIKRLTEDPRGAMFDYVNEIPRSYNTYNPVRPQSEDIAPVRYSGFEFQSYESALRKVDLFSMDQLMSTVPDDLKEEIGCLEDFADQPYRYFTDSAHMIANRMLLVGPPGSGKSSLALTIAYKSKRKYLFISAASLGNEYKNSSITILDQLFDPLIYTSEPTVLIFDEITAFTDKFNSMQNSDPGAVEHFWIKLDACRNNPFLLVIFTANSTERLPETIKDRFVGYQFSVNLPNRALREAIFKHHFRTVPELNDSYFVYLSKKTDNFSLREINSIIKLSKKNALYRILKSPSPYSTIMIAQDDIEAALQKIMRDHKKSNREKKWQLCKQILREAGPYIVPVLSLATGIYFQYQNNHFFISPTGPVKS